MKINLFLGVSLGILLGACGKKTQETKPIRKDVTETVFASGILEAKGSYQLTAQVEGYLQSINFEEGQVVSKGQILAVIDNKENQFNTESAEALYQIAKTNTEATAPALMQAQNAIIIAKQKLALDSVQKERYQRLVERNSVAKTDFDNALLTYNNAKISLESAVENYKQLKIQANQAIISNNTQKQVSNLALNKNMIRAVVTGRIYKKYKQPGDFVKKGDVIALIGDAQNIYAKVNVDESNIIKLKLGQKAVVQLNVNKSKLYKATLVEIYPNFDEATQSFFCKLSFDEPLDFLINGTQLQSNIQIETNKNALLIPRNFLDFGGNVYIKGQKDPVKISTKFVSNEWVQVLSGITENTILTTENISANKTTTSEVGSQMR